MASVFLIFFPFIFFCLLNVWMVYLSKRAFGICIPVTLMVATLVIYASQLIFHTFNVGFYVLFVVAGTSICLIVVRRKDGLLKDNYFSWGFFSFLVIYILFAIVNYDRHFWFWDELSHWGKMVKEMIRIDRFYSDNASELLVHKEYPPFAAIFEMLWCRLSGGYSEMAVTMSLNIFTFTLLITNLIDTLKLKKEAWYNQLITGGILTGIFLLTILSFDVSCTSLTICPDLFMSVMYVYIISLILNRDEIRTGFGYFSFLIGMISLIIIKQMSIAFVLLAWFFFTIMEFSDEAGIRKLGSKQIFKKCALSAMAIVAPFVSYQVWGNYSKSIENSGQFFLGKISIGSLAMIFSGDGTDIQNRTFHNFINALFTQAQSAGIFKMPYIFAMVVAVVLLGLIYYWNKDRFTKNNFIAMLLLFLLGSAGYAFTMLVLYMFCYSEDEMAILSGYNRYMGSYVISEYLVLIILAFYVLKRSNRERVNIGKLVLCAIVIFVFSDYTKLAYVIPQVLRGEPFADYRIKAQNIELHTDDNSRIFLISSDNAKNMFYLNYYSDNRGMDSRYLFSDVAKQNSTDLEFWNQVVACLKEDDYLYVYDTTDFADEVIGKYTETGVLTDNTIYHIKSDADELELIKLE